jgi:Arc/MetJ-type ribon-helix-helix transcriptional regulator
MFLVTLVSKILAGPNKDKPNLIEITSTKLTVDDGNGKQVPLRFGDESYVDSTNKEHVGIPAEQWAYPQFGPEPSKNDKGEYLSLSDEQAQQALDEMMKDAGGIVPFVENYNDATRKAALDSGKIYIRTKEDGNPSDIIREGIRRAKEFTWAAASRVTNKSVREGAENLLADIEKLSKDEMAARLKALLGKG